MTAINNMLADFGWVIAYFMAFLILMAIIVVICSFLKIVLKWYKTNRY